MICNVRNSTLHHFRTVTVVVLLFLACDLEAVELGGWTIDRSPRPDPIRPRISFVSCFTPVDEDEGPRFTTNSEFFVPQKDLIQQLRGDLDGDGILSILDVRILFDAILGKASVTPSQFSAADLNQDSRENILDARMLLDLVLEQDTTEGTPTPSRTPTPSPTPSILPQPTVPIHPDDVVVNLPDLPAGAKPLVLVKIPSGTYVMGSAAGEVGRSVTEGPPHTVTLGKPFYISRYEITREQWNAVVEPYQRKRLDGVPDVPVTDVTWKECLDFSSKLDVRRPGSTHAFRLPTEAEWEYACRAKTITRYYWGNDLGTSMIDGYAWYRKRANPVVRPQPVGMKRPNAYGLFDMSGNVREWCLDRFGAYPGSPQTDPIASTFVPSRVTRGGSFSESEEGVRSASRSAENPETRWFNLGFRVVFSEIHFDLNESSLN